MTAKKKTAVKKANTPQPPITISNCTIYGAPTAETLAVARLVAEGCVENAKALTRLASNLEGQAAIQVRQS